MFFGGNSTARRQEMYVRRGLKEPSACHNALPRIAVVLFSLLFVTMLPCSSRLEMSNISGCGKGLMCGLRYLLFSMSPNFLENSMWAKSSGKFAFRITQTPYL